MACFGISIGDLLPSWLKRSVATPNSNLSCTNSSHNIFLQEGRGSPTSHRSSVNSKTGYVSGTLELPCPSPAHLSTLSKSVMDDEYHMWKPFAYNPTPPLPMTGSRPRRKPSVVYSSTLGVKRFLKYEGVRYKPGSPYYLWLFVRYDDSAEGYVGVPSLSFNANVSLQQELKDLVPPSEWQDLQDKYGFGFIDQIM